MKEMAAVSKWSYVVAALLACISSSNGLSFEIEREMNMPDVIPNNIEATPDGNWREIPCRSSCSQFNTDSPMSNCKCRCSHAFSTFVMGATSSESRCYSNRLFRTKIASCTIQLQAEGSLDSKLPVVDLSSSHKEPIKAPSVSQVQYPRCDINGLPQYWDKGVWSQVREGTLFGFYSPNYWTNLLTWQSSQSYNGRIVRVPIRCNGTNDKTLASCIVLKIKGTLSYDIFSSTTVAPTTTETPKTTKAPKTPITIPKITTNRPQTSTITAKITTESTTATQATTKTKEYTTIKPSTTEESTTNEASTAEFESTTAAQATTKTEAYTTKKPSTTEGSTTTEASTAEFTFTPTKSSVKSTHTIKGHTTEHVSPPDTNPSDSPTTTANSVPGSARKGDGQKHETSVTITAISAAAAVICVSIISLLIWCILKHRKKQRNEEAYSADMTVIMNSTGQNNNNNNHVGGGKSAIYDEAVYCEPSDQSSSFHKRRLPALANPVYDRALAKPPGSSRHLKNLIAERRGSSNIYDNREMQSDTCCHVNKACDVYDDVVEVKPRLTEGLYEALSEDHIGQPAYQPLVRENKEKAHGSSFATETPEYLTILPDDAGTDNIRAPRPTEKASDTYDYADTRALNKLPTNPSNTTEPPSYQSLDQSTRGQSPPSDGLVYGVLENSETSTGKGPRAVTSPVYDVLEEMDEAPIDKLPDVPTSPVYDSLEKPNTEYLVPTDGVSQSRNSRN
ncbi:uncharacterized protein LOC116617571 [Nematostella vectensis]|uniref:uncharacterized protein LOC116617571 n=1 Tax=Nematostella vectensis TaxID=45351 RepID=UPI0020774CC3|nr:uncharacterized protein LOC116617571 [Nematostella vectensis]